jgi:hypothetical protein
VFKNLAVVQPLGSLTCTLVYVRVFECIFHVKIHRDSTNFKKMEEDNFEKNHTVPVLVLYFYYKCRWGG